MEFDEVAIEGTLKADGSIELDQRPNLPPGRVTVIVHAAKNPVPQQESWWEFMQ